ncbi:hypothetical protein GCM10010218_13240 [Streptomyces mashuensis]|uniref:Uncharacterized protein n=1 Tax=Streptomyces mashuensis TaxID=33904 RepID=A0A919AZ40_9ACTN|nr:hypothetical protein [Streptomyces mashuensis]GHF33498.1 hypothetical protein GCM10010218_13240 [Streptomyces mashuensis]
MRELSNLSWSDTPYGADKRPFPKQVQLLTGMAMQWADEAGEPVPVSAAAVFVPVKRTQATAVEPGTLHFGFHVAVAETAEDTPGLVSLADRILVQARREAAGLAWHSFPDDLHVTLTVAAGRLPGFTAVGEAWKDRTVRERGTAPLVDTASDLGRYNLPTQAANAEGIDLGANLAAFQDVSVVQAAHDDLAAISEARELLVQQLAAGILGQALATALLGGKAMNRLTWSAPFRLSEALALEAWHVLPQVYGPDSGTVKVMNQ